MVVVGVLLIVAVLLDAWRRIRRDRNARVKLKLVDPDSLPPEVPGDLRSYGELPNGGARVVERGDILRAAGYPPGGKAAAPANTAAGRRAEKPSKKQANKSVTEDGDELIRGMTSIAAEDDAQNLDWLDGLVAHEDDSQKSSAPPPGKLPRGVEPEVFMLNVVARSAQGFRGDDILQILLACDLRFCLCVAKKRFTRW